MTADQGDSDAELDAIELWFVERGVPHFVETKTDGSILDTWTRALPLLVAAYVLLGLNALDLVNGTLGENVVTAFVVVVVLVATWSLSNRLRGEPTFARPTDIDAPELALFVVGPALPALLYGQVRDAIESAVSALVLLGLIYVWSAYGVGPLIRWAARQGTRQISSLGSLVARALPLLLLFNTFLFINAEVWELAGTLTGPAYIVVIMTFFGLGATFSLSRVPRVIRGLNDFESWEELDGHLAGTPADELAPVGERTDLPRPDDRLRVRQRLNLGLVVLFGQALQITLVTAVLTAFFVGFGFVGITTATTTGWTGLDDVHVLLEAGFGGRTLVLSEPLVRVSVFLGAFSGMYFTVVLTTDDTYRSEIDDAVGPEIRQALAVRTAYRVRRGTYRGDEMQTETPAGDRETDTTR